MKVSIQALGEVQAAIDDFEREVKAAGLTRSSEQTYILHARQFVRWLGDDFSPGGHLRGAQSRPDPE